MSNGFPFDQTLEFVSINSISGGIFIFVNWTKMIGLMETQIYFNKFDVNNKKNGTSKTMGKTKQSKFKTDIN